MASRLHMDPRSERISKILGTVFHASYTGEVSEMRADVQDCITALFCRSGRSQQAIPVEITSPEGNPSSLAFPTIPQADKEKRKKLLHEVGSLHVGEKLQRNDHKVD